MNAQINAASSVELTIVIPVLNEARHLSGLLKRLRVQAPGVEVVVVDGGSTDGTVDVAQRMARVLLSPPGRAAQMNYGAVNSKGAWLLFLHADTALPDAFLKAIAEAETKGYRAGAFSLSIAGDHPLLRVLGWGATLRTSLLRIALGDQALFCRRDLFNHLRGFPDVPIMEDYLFTRLLRQRGEGLFLSPLQVTTSGRRWEQQGVWRTWWQFRRLYWRVGRALREDSVDGSALAAHLEALRQEYEDVR